MYTSLCTNEADVRDVTGRSTRAVALNRGYSREEEREREGEVIMLAGRSCVHRSLCAPVSIHPSHQSCFNLSCH
jgi:hypothetical protein